MNIKGLLVDMFSKLTRRKFCSNLAATTMVTAVPIEVSATQGSRTGKPFVKWAGGKGQLIEQLEALFPADLAERKNLTYVEPFVGGGAMVFHILAA